MLKGQRHSLEERIHLSKLWHLKRGLNFNGFLTSLEGQIRNSFEYNEWKNKVFERDRFTCKCKEGGDLVHHKVDLKEILKIEKITSFEEIKNDSLLWSVDNGETLCLSCHQKEHWKKHRLTI